MKFNIKTFKDGINTQSSKEDIKNSEVVEMVNFQCSPDGDITFADQFDYLRMPYNSMKYGRYNPEDTTNDSEDDIPYFTLVPGFGCTTFKSDYCLIAPVRHSDNDHSGINGLWNDTNFGENIVPRNLYSPLMSTTDNFRNQG